MDPRLNADQRPDDTSDFATKCGTTGQGVAAGEGAAPGDRVAAFSDTGPANEVEEVEEAFLDLLDLFVLDLPL